MRSGGEAGGTRGEEDERPQAAKEVRRLFRGQSGTGRAASAGEEEKQDSGIHPCAGTCSHQPHRDHDQHSARSGLFMLDNGIWAARGKMHMGAGRMSGGLAKTGPFEGTLNFGTTQNQAGEGERIQSQKVRNKALTSAYGRRLPLALIFV